MWQVVQRLAALPAMQETVPMVMRLLEDGVLEVQAAACNAAAQLAVEQVKQELPEADMEDATLSSVPSGLAVGTLRECRIYIYMLQRRTPPPVMVWSW